MGTSQVTRRETPRLLRQLSYFDQQPADDPPGHMMSSLQAHPDWQFALENEESIPIREILFKL